MDMHSVLISLKDVVVNVLMIFFDHQLEDKFVELNKIKSFRNVKQEHQDLLDHIEMLFKNQSVFVFLFILFYLLIQMHILYDL